MKQAKPDKAAKGRSKLLSLVLRHQPELAGLQLGPGGWVNIDDLLAGLAAMNKAISRDQLLALVKANDKRRFSVSKDGVAIRAAQGHSINIDLGLSPRQPPAILYHGTATRFMKVIAREGLRPMARDHVHLSADIDTATKVGARHGSPVILSINAAGLHQSGQEFFKADNAVWLTASIAPKWFEMLG